MNMITKLLFFVLVATSCYAADVSSPTNTSVPTIIVDNDHFLVHSSHPTNHGLFYNIKPSPGLLVDTTHYTFDLSQLHGKPVTEIWLTRLPDVFMYRTAWKHDKVQHELSKTTLQPFDGMPSFGGFKAGETWIVMICRSEPKGGSIAWMGRVEVH